MTGRLDLEKLQREVAVWHRHNFPAALRVQIALKLAEEVGELAHAANFLHDKLGDQQKVREAEIDAIGDILLVLVAYCARGNINLAAEAQKVWEEVKMRDWQADPVNGGKKRDGDGGLLIEAPVGCPRRGEKKDA